MQLGVSMQSKVQHLEGNLMTCRRFLARDAIAPNATTTEEMFEYFREPDVPCSIEDPIDVLVRFQAPLSVSKSNDNDNFQTSEIKSDVADLQRQFDEKFKTAHDKFMILVESADQHKALMIDERFKTADDKFKILAENADQHQALMIQFHIYCHNFKAR